MRFDAGTSYVIGNKPVWIDFSLYFLMGRAEAREFSWQSSPSSLIRRVLNPHPHKNTCGRTRKCNCVFSDLKFRWRSPTCTDNWNNCRAGQQRRPSTRCWSRILTPNGTQTSTSPPNYIRFPTPKKVDEFLEIDESCERASFPDQQITCGNLTINCDHP